MLCLLCGHLLLLFEFVISSLNSRLHQYINLKSQLLLLVWFSVMFPLPLCMLHAACQPRVRIRATDLAVWRGCPLSPWRHRQCGPREVRVPRPSYRHWAQWDVTRFPAGRDGD